MAAEPEPEPEAALPAGTPDDPLSLAFDALGIQRDRAPAYPLRPAEAADCVATVLVDRNGHVKLESIDAAPDGRCPGALHPAITEALHRWRFDSPVHPDTEKPAYARVGIPFEFAGASGELLRKTSDDELGQVFRSYERTGERTSDLCALSLRVSADGRAVDRTTNDRYNCLAMPGGKPPKKLFKRVKGGLLTCEVTLNAVGTSATDVASDCAVAEYLPDLLAGWSFNGTENEGGRPYRLTLVFSSGNAE